MPDTFPAISPESATIVTHADSFVVVSLWRNKSGDGTSYDYEMHGTLNDTLDAYRDLEDGEYPRARAVGIFAAKNGLPIGGRLDPSLVLRLMRETRRAT